VLEGIIVNRIILVIVAVVAVVVIAAGDGRSVR
jgi:hypothetical protein